MHTWTYQTSEGPPEDPPHVIENKIKIFVIFFQSPNGTDDFLENRVPCLDKSIRYRKRPFDKTEVSVQVTFYSPLQWGSKYWRA